MNTIFNNLAYVKGILFLTVLPALLLKNILFPMFQIPIHKNCLLYHSVIETFHSKININLSINKLVWYSSFCFNTFLRAWMTIQITVRKILLSNKIDLMTTNLTSDGFSFKIVGWCSCCSFFRSPNMTKNLEDFFTSFYPPLMCI